MDKISKIQENGYKALACSIVEQAALDYYESRFFLETIDERFIKVSKNKTRVEVIDRLIMKYERTVDDCKRFFLSSWFETLSGLDGEKAFEAINDTYKNEIYDQMHEELIENEYRKALNRTIKFLKTLS